MALLTHKNDHLRNPSTPSRLRPSTPVVARAFFFTFCSVVLQTPGGPLLLWVPGESSRFTVDFCLRRVSNPLPFPPQHLGFYCFLFRRVGAGDAAGPVDNQGVSEAAVDEGLRLAWWWSSPRLLSHIAGVT